MLLLVFLYLSCVTCYLSFLNKLQREIHFIQSKTVYTVNFFSKQSKRQLYINITIESIADKT